MVRLLISFCLALVSHIYLLQTDISVNSSLSPQLTSDNSVSVTLSQPQKKQAVKSTPLSSQLEQKSNQVTQSDDLQVPLSEPVSTEVFSSKRPASIRPQAYKVKKERTSSNAPALQEQPADEIKQAVTPLVPRAVTPLTSAKFVSKEAALSVIKARPMYQQNPKPEYPDIARRRGWEGIVMLEVEVTGEGKPATIKLHKSCGYGILDKSALRAVKKWRFLAGTTDGRPVTTTVIIPIHFILRK